MAITRVQTAQIILPASLVLLGSTVFLGLPSRATGPPEAQEREAGKALAPSDVDSRPRSQEQAPFDSLGDPLPSGALARCGTTRLRHGELIRSVAVSPDGKIVASVGESVPSNHPGYPDPVVRLWDAATGTELRQCRGHVRAPIWVLFSPDGKTLASLAAEETEKADTVRLWDAATGKQLHVLKHGSAHTGRSLRNALVFSADGRMLASSGADRAIRLWEVATGKEVRSWTEPEGSLALAFSPDGKLLACAVGKTVALLAVNAGTARQTEVGDGADSIEAIQFGPDGKTMVTGSYHLHFPAGKFPAWVKRTGAVQWWEVATGRELHHLSGTALASTPDRRWLAIREDRHMVLWDMAADMELRRFPLEDASPLDPALDSFSGSFSADGATLVAPDCGRIRILDARAGKEEHFFRGHSGDVVFVGFSPDGRRLISAADTSVRTWDPRTGKELANLPGHQRPISGAALTADGKILAAAASDCTIRQWDLEAVKEARRLPMTGYGCLSFSPDGNTLVVNCGEGGSICTFEAGRSRLRLRFNYDRGGQALAFLSDGQVLAELSSTIALYDPDSGEFLGEFQDMRKANRTYTGLTASPDGTMAATGFWEANQQPYPVTTVSLWESASGKLIAEFRGHKRLASSFAFAHSGRVMASGSWDGTIRVWDLPSGRQLRKFEGHCGGVLSLAFSADDKMLASGSSDTSILVWDVAEFAARRPLPGVRLSAADLKKLWTELGADSAEVAYHALWQFAEGGKPAVAFLKEELSSDPAAEERVRKLIGELDADQFEVRERATQELALLGPKARPWLQKALDQPPSAEVRKRVEKLVESLPKLGHGPTGAELRQLRAVQALEYGGTPEGRELLEMLAGQESETPRGLAAKAALKR